MHVLCVIGTRPEAIKLAPVIQALAADPETFRVRLSVTAQHRELLDGVLRHFSLEADDDLDLMRPNQSLSDLSDALFSRLGELFQRHRPDWILVQGDTTSAMVGAVAGVLSGARVAHVEAGLRTGRLTDPFPEELNRQCIGRAAHLHFAPTERARANLLSEGVSASDIEVTGNTGIDALLWTLGAIDADDVPANGRVRSILVTMHRREAFGETFDRMCGALADLATAAGPNVRLVCPVHPNPNVSGPMRAILGDLPGIQLIDPVDYRTAVKLLNDCDFVMTDSGGLQEEAPALGKPVLVMREVTERPEGISAGVAELVGRDPDRIVAAALRLLHDDEAYRRMARVALPYGDGHAAPRIVAALRARAQLPR